MIDVSIGYMLYLHNYIPITREDTRRGSAATKLRRAVERTKTETNAAQVKRGRNGLWCMANLNRKEVRTVYRSYKMKAAKLLQQSGGTPRFGKRRRHLQQV